MVEGRGPGLELQQGDAPSRLYARWLVRSRNWLLLAAVILTALTWRPAMLLRLDESIESFFSDRDPHLIGYRENKSLYGGDEFVLVAYEVPVQESSSGNGPEAEEQRWSPPYLLEEERTRLREFGERLGRIPGVNPSSVQDLATTLRNPRATGILSVAQRLPSTEKSLINLSRRLLVGDDDKTVCIALRLVAEKDAPISRRETFRLIREEVAAFDLPAYVAGEPLQVHDMFRYVEADGWTMGFASSSLLVVAILIMFRSLRWVALPLLVVHITLIWTKGLLYLSGLELSMVSSMLTSLVTIIGIATVTHVTITFREQRARLDRVEAFAETFSLLWLPILGTCVTTAIGFLSLLVSSVTPVRSFGIMMALGTALVPVVCLTILPAGILSGGFDTDPQRVPAEGTLLDFLRRLARWTARRGKYVLGLLILLAGFGVAGLFKLRVETDFSKNFRESSPIILAMKFFESRLGGAGTWDLGFNAPEVLHDEFLAKVADLADELREIDLETASGEHAQLTKVVAITDGLNLVPRLPKSNTGGGILGMLAGMRVLNLQERIELMKSLQPEMFPTLYNPKQGKMRLALRAMEQQPAEVKLGLIAEVERIGRKYFPEARATGLYVLLANLITSLLSDQLISFLAAAAGIAIAIGVEFRSFRIGLISLVPNALPIVLLVGGIGWLGVPANIGTAMIASVSMGLTVDSTIHYLAHYQRLRLSGASHEAAVEESHAGVGRALVLANIALVIGFSVLALSHFIPLVYFGVLVSVAMVGGLMGNLFVLPVLIGLGTDLPGSRQDGQDSNATIGA